MDDTRAVTPLVFVGAGAALGVLALFLLYLSWQKQLNEEKHAHQAAGKRRSRFGAGEAASRDTFEAQKKI